MIGGGVIGTACAHYLEAVGYSVSLIDRGRVGGEASHGNCGVICPSHLLPLAEPGVIGQVLGSFFRRRSPFFVAPRVDFDLWRWLFRFAGNCREDQMIKTGHAALGLLQQSRRLYDELINEYGLACNWETTGTLYVCKLPQTFASFSSTVKLLQNEYGVAARSYLGENILALEPTLRPGLAGAWHFPGDAHLRPDRLLQSWRDSLVERDVKILENTALQELVFNDGRPIAARTTRGKIAADHFVFATGAFTPQLSSQLGWSPPIQPAKGYSLTMPRPEHCPNYPLNLVDYGVVATPWKSGYRLGSILEFSGYNRKIDPHRVALLRTGANECLKEACADTIEETWVGWRSMTPNGLPCIDRCPIASNVYVAAGHNMLGMSMATGTGQMIAQMIDERVPSVDPDAYRLQF